MTTATASNDGRPRSSNAMSRKPVLYGPLRDNAPNRIPRPALAFHKDFFAGFRDQVNDPPLASTTKNTYIPHPSSIASVKESKSVFLQSSKFDKQVHFNLGHAGGSKADKQVNVPAGADFQPPCPIVPTNLYPPLFRDESLTANHNYNTQYASSYTSTPPQAMTARFYKGMKMDRPVCISFGSDAERIDGQSVTHLHFPHVPIDGQQFAHARAIALRQAKPAIVLACPESKEIDRRSTIQSCYVPYGSADLVKPDLSFKANLVSSHLSLHSHQTSNHDNQFTSQYKKSFKNAQTPLRRVLPIITPTAQLLNESNDPTETTSQNAYIPHTVLRHRPIHRIDVSHVFSACNSIDNSPHTPKKLPIPSQIHSGTHKDCLSTFQHVMHLQDQAPALVSSTQQDLTAPSCVTDEYIAGRMTSQTLKTNMSEAHWHTGSNVAPTETTYAHHLGTSAKLADQLNQSQPAGHTLDLGLRRIPVIPDTGFYTSLHNTMHSDFDNDSRPLPVGSEGGQLNSCPFRTTTTSNNAYGSSFSKQAYMPQKCTYHVTSKFLLTNQFDQQLQLPWISTSHRVHVAPQ